MMGMTITGSGKGVYQLPKSRTDLIFETPIGDIAITTISDGKTLWQIEQTPLGKQVVRHDLSKPLEDGQTPIDPFMAFAGVKTREFLDEILARFEPRVLGIDESADPAVYVLTLENRSGSDIPTIRFEIGVQDAFPRKMSIFTPEGERITTMTVTELAFNVDADDSLFTYKPGPDEQVVDAADLMKPRVRSPSVQTGMEGRPAPDFKLTSLDGREVSLASFRGQHVLIDFWATWCPPCKKALPIIQTLSEGTDGLVVLTVNAEPPSVSRPFVERYGYTFATLVDADRSVSSRYGVTAIPTTFIIAPDGTIAKHMVGYHTAEQLHRALSASGLAM
jgi:peroxiredoxin/outer membrane lipoprotein-sorting protein